MNIKKSSALYFSPTGGTKKIAEHIASGLCDAAEFLDVTSSGRELAFGPEDFVVIAAPTNYDPDKNYFDTSSVEQVIEQALACGSQSGKSPALSC